MDTDSVGCSVGGGVLGGFENSIVLYHSIYSIAEWVTTHFLPKLRIEIVSKFIILHSIAECYPYMCTKSWDSMLRIESVEGHTSVVTHSAVEPIEW